MALCPHRDGAVICLGEADHPEGAHTLARVFRAEAPAPTKPTYSRTDKERFTLVAAAMKRAGMPVVARSIEWERDHGPTELFAAEGARTPTAAETNP